jgi:hypothetical protein
MGHGVDDMNPVALAGEPLGVNSGASADIEDGTRGFREIAAQNFLRAKQLQLP